MHEAGVVHGDIKVGVRMGAHGCAWVGVRVVVGQHGDIKVHCFNASSLCCMALPKSRNQHIAAVLSMGVLFQQPFTHNP